ncbi:hypothetical protein SAMN05421866_0014 [Chryseobacterium oranimense]|uniref:Uncharacterized protein n=1 Tax=Chryseobacterium oranimense TaxID=421058 RepID=A0A1M5X6X5_9FLAO|nr:hypothetical protein [Chryseobacterium oranimense]SHH95590.1 hypothetical protein SAMN05421866_0014 [Chryseobacterium oranimense]
MDSIRIAEWKLVSSEKMLNIARSLNSPFLKDYEDTYKKYLHNYNIVLAYNKAFNDLMKWELLVRTGKFTKSPFLEMYKKRLREQAQLVAELENRYIRF